MENKKSKVFVVMKFETTVTLTALGEERVVPISGIKGFIPVYGTMQEAEEASQGGKFQILEMELGDTSSDNETKE